MPEAVAMLLQDRRQQSVVGRIAAFDHLPVADKPVFHFGIVHHMAKLRLVRFGLAPPNHLGVGLEQTQDLRGSGDRAFRDDPLLGLRDGLFDQRDELRELFPEMLGRRLRLALHDEQDLLRLSQRGPGDGQQLAIGFFLARPAPWSAWNAWF